MGQRLLSFPEPRLAKARRQRSERRKHGVVYTPPALARLMVEAAIGAYLAGRGPTGPLTVLDPAAGEGVFLGEAARHVASLGEGVGTPFVAGVDVDGAALARAAAALRGARAVCCLVTGDAVRGTAPEAPAEAPDRFASWFPEVMSDGGFAVVVANPPYVRHEHVAGKAVLAARVAAILPDAGAPPPRSDLSIYLFARALDALRKDGVLAFVVPSSWLTASYGVWLRRLIRGRLVSVCEPAARPAFGDADVHPVVLLLRKGRVEGPVLFVRLDRPDEPGGVEALRGAPAIGGGPQAIAVPREALDPEASWSAWLRWAAVGTRMDPETLRRLCDGPCGVPLAHLGRLAYGTKPGLVRFFYLDEERVGRFGIEPRHVGHILSSTRDVATIETTGETPLFLVRGAPGEGAQAYIRWAEAQGWHRVRSVAGRRPAWYCLPGEPCDLAVPQFWDRTFRVLHLDPPSLVANNVWGIALRPDIEPWRAVAVTNSLLFFLQVELSGRTNQAQGVLTTYGPELSTLRVLDPSRLPERLTGAVESLSRRPLLDAFHEYGPDAPADRAALDEAVFRAAGLGARALRAARAALLALVADRLRRSRRGS